jgi:WD40 repeat protein
LTAFGARERLSFAPLGTTASTVQVAAGDVDGDGRPELIASAGRHVVIFRRDGSTLASFTVASDSSVAAADLDSDGKAEVITGSETDGTVRVFSIRDGVALERTSFSTGVPGVSIAAGDLNRDSKAAIVVGALRGAPVVKVFGANGTQRSSFAIPSAGAGPVAVAVGPSRIVTATHGVVHIFDANGSSTYPEFEPYAGYSGDVTVAVGDTNGDDYPDVITDGDGQPVRIFSLLGTQATQFAQFAAFDPTVRGAVSLAATDTNGNGTDEILTGAPAGAGGQVRLLYGFRDCAPQPNAWHVYDPTQPEVYLPPYEFGVSPGFARALVRPGDPSLDRDLSRWTQNVTHMALSRLPWQLVETFNEWGEGTSIESAQEWATPSGYGAYLDALHAAG